jgi:hypothetical protein
MAGRRVATAVVAVALIVGAFFLRRNVIEGGDNEPDATDGPDSAAELVCVTELDAVCEALGDSDPELSVTVEDARVTLDRVAAGETVPLWLTFEPFPAMAGSLAAGDVLAASQLVVGTRSPRQAELSTRCANQALWRCVGDLAGEAWNEPPPGQIEPSVGDAARSASGLASFAAAVAGYFGAPQFSTVELSDPSFLAWVRPFVDAVPVEELTAGTPVGTMLTRQSAVNVAGTSDAEITALGEPGTNVERSYPEPSMWLQAVLAAPAGAGVPDDLTADATAALLDTGWERPDPSHTPLPSATTMLALRGLWEEIQ